MPIFDQGYQHWQGRLSGHAWRWWTITRQGVRTQWRSRWTKVAVFIALVPALALAAVLILWGLIEQQSSLIAPLLSLLRDLPEEIRTGPRNYRTAIWTIAYQYFFQFQMFFCMVLVLLIGPSLISQDLRFNAIPLYFSRPLRRIDYFMGKLGVIAVFLSCVAIVPAVLAYGLGLAFSLDFAVFKDTYRLLLASVGYGALIVLSAGTLMLAMSSLSRNSRYVGALWVGIWFISNVVAGVLTGVLRRDWCPMVSYTGNLEHVGRTLLNTTEAWERIGRFFNTRMREAVLPGLIGPTYPWYWSAAVLAVLMGLSVWILAFRVKTLDRLK